MGIEPIHVYKFGGTSQRDLEAMSQCAAILASDPYARAAVFSAPAGVTNLLEAAASEAYGTGKYPHSIAQQIILKYSAVLKDRLDSDKMLTHIENVIYDRLIVQLPNKDLDINKDKYFANVLAVGEEKQAEIMASFLERNNFKINLLPNDALLLDGDSWSYLDGVYNRESDEIIRSYLKQDSLMIAAGFIGINSQCERVVFQRGGSDYTQTLLARALGATAAYNCTDVCGILEINPALVLEEERKNLRTLKELSYEQAMDLSRQGARVLHSKALQPVEEKQIPLYVMNTFDPNGSRTKIYNKPQGEPRFIAVTGKKQSFKSITLHAGAMEGKEGYFSRFSGALSNVDIDTITTSSTRITASFSYARDNLDVALEKISTLGHVAMDNGVALIAMVGENIGKNPKLLGDMFYILGNNNIPVNQQISKADNASIWVAVPVDDFERAQIALYDGLLKKTN
ncbi:MAG: aspartate kinase [Candidatus Nanoarchaeia archaeon]